MPGFWKRIFGGSPEPGGRPDRAAAILAEAEALARPCLRLSLGGAGLSRFGGTPAMAGEWPRYQGRPLSFVAQLDLAEVRAAGGPDWLPDEGRLLFFYEFEHGSWGIEPADAGSAVVRYERGAATLAAEPADLPGELRTDPQAVAFAAATSRPSAERLGVDRRKLSASERSALEAGFERLAPPEPVHQVGGYPGAVQGDGMELDCQLLSQGISLGRGVSAQVAAGAEDWRLLLQLDTDEASQMCWCDSGRLYFWVRETDARAGDFAKAWVRLQCF